MCIFSRYHVRELFLCFVGMWPSLPLIWFGNYAGITGVVYDTAYD